MNPYQALANAIVKTAASDYRNALKRHYKHPHLKKYANEVAELEEFFRSDWYELLTSLDGRLLVESIQRMVRKEVAA